jgi:repressor LexA
MFADMLKKLRTDCGWSQQELAKKAGLAKSTISMLENGERKPSFEVLETLADIFNVNLDVLRGRTDSGYYSEGSEILVPVIAEIAAGFDKQPIRDYEMDRFPVPSVYAKGRRTDELFIIKVRGDSMYPMYQEGDHILAVRTPTVEDGEVAILQYEDNATIKRVERVKDGLRLIPINPMYKSETVTDSDKVRVVGKPLVLIRELAEDIKT